MPLAGLVAGLLAGLVAACTGVDQPAAPAGGPGELRILAGSELSDLEPLLDRAGDEIGVEVQLTYTGTLDGAEQIATGAADGMYDASWFSSDRYLSLLPEAEGAIRASDDIMVSPVLLGVRASVAGELGWDETAPTWAEIAAAAAAGDLRFGMTDPASSNSGFSALVGVATAVADTGESLTAEDVAAVTPTLAGFFSGQDLTAGSSGWLAERYVARQATLGGGEPGGDATGEDATGSDGTGEDGTAGASAAPPLDGLVNYESVLLALDAGGRLAEPLTVVYPADGVVVADYPLSLLSSADDTARAPYEALVAWLLAPAQQEAIMASTLRRPAVPAVALDPVFGDQVLVDLPFPSRPEVADGLVDAYLNELRPPTQTVYVLDTSGSMATDGRLADLQGAVAALAGADDSLSGRFARFRDRERVTLVAFATVPGEPVTFEVPAEGGDGVRAEIAGQVGSYAPAGETAIYDSLRVAYEVAEVAEREDPAAFTSIVLMSDGENTRGSELADFAEWYAGQPAEARGVPTFTVAFGDSDVAELEALAELTGGRAFDATTGDLGDAFQEIRGYQ